jgi:hypothetical protein
MFFQLLPEAKEKAVLHFATVCSSWVSINRGTSGRSAWCPLGRAHPYVLRANTMVSRSAFLMLLGLCLGIDVVLEQPSSSIMFLHPRIQQIVHLAQSGGIRTIHQITTFMGAFGAPSPKMTFLLGSPTWLHRLVRTIKRSDFKTAGLDIVSRAVVNGKTTFTGSTGLKKTQEYPAGYGLATAALMRSAVEYVDSDDEFDYLVLDEEAEPYRTGGAEFWCDAELKWVWNIVFPGNRQQ